MPALLIALLAIACAGSPPGPPDPGGEPPQPDVAPAQPETAAGEPGDPGHEGEAEASRATVVELRLDETVTASGLELRWVELADSRCPEGVQCIWEGEAVVTLEVAGEEIDPTRIELALRPGRPGPPVTVGGHELRLLAVEPYPRAGERAERSEQVATLELRAAQSG